MSIRNNNPEINQVMLDLENFPVLNEHIILKEALDLMDKFHLGIACITDNHGKLVGIITDGDIRRKLSAVQKPLSSFFVDDSISHAIKNPVVIDENSNVFEALDLMEKNQIWDLPVVNQNRLVGLIHMHSIASLLKNKV